MTTAVGYVRTHKTESFLTNEAQIEGLRAYCARHKIRLLAVHEDNDTGDNRPVGKRTGFLSAVNALYTGGASTLVASSWAVLSRDPVRSAALEALVERAGGTIQVVAGSRFQRGSEVRLCAHAREVLEEFESAAAGAKVRAGMAQKRQAGVLMGTAPFGWRNEAGRAVEDPAEQATLQFIYRCRDGGYSHDDNVTAPKSTAHKPRGKAWHRTTVARILSKRP